MLVPPLERQVKDPRSFSALAKCAAPALVRVVPRMFKSQRPGALVIRCLLISIFSTTGRHVISTHKCHACFSGENVVSLVWYKHETE